MTKVPSKVVVARIEKRRRICRVSRRPNGQDWCCLLVMGDEGIKKSKVTSRVPGSIFRGLKTSSPELWNCQRRDVLWPNRQEKRKTTD